jgi:hypothetical protein
VVRLHPSALSARQRTRPLTLPTSPTRAGTRAEEAPSAARSMGMRFFWKNTSFAPRRSGFDSRRLHSHASVVSTASTRPLYGRGAGSTPAGGSVASHRTPVAQRNEHCPATAEDAGSIPAGRIHADVAQREEHRVASPERPVRDGSSALEDSWCNGSTPSSNLGGPGSIPGESAARRRGPERLGYLMERGAQALAVRHRGPDRTP